MKLLPALLFIFSAQLAASQDSVLRYIDSPHGWPYAFHSDNTLDGILPRIIKLIADEHNISLKVQTGSDRRALEQIAKGLSDITVILSYQMPNLPPITPANYPDHLYICETPISSGKINIISHPQKHQNQPESKMKVGVLRLVHFEASALKSSTNKPPTNKTTLNEGTAAKTSSVDPSSVDSSFIDTKDQRLSYIEYKSFQMLIKSLIANRIDALIGDPEIVDVLYNLLSSQPLPLTFQPAGEYALHIAMHKNWQIDSQLKQQVCQTAAKQATQNASERFKQQIIKTPLSSAM